MQRPIVYPGSIPLDTDLLSTNQNVMVALGYLIQLVVGTGTVVDGLACGPTVPASMSVVVGPGSIASMVVIEASAYGSLPADTTDPLMKMGINTSGTNFALTAPTVSGESINYLIEATFQEGDGTPVVLPYYNAANPAMPYSGPANSGVPQNTVRNQVVELQLKAGAPAAAGTQVTPAVDSGWVGLYVITVNYGQTTVTSGSISVYPGAPFLAEKLTSLGSLLNGYAPLNSPAFIGTPTAPTPTSGDSSTKIPTTAFVADALSGLASLASPAFTGTPTAPTPASGNSSANLATTEFVNPDSNWGSSGGYRVEPDGSIVQCGSTVGLLAQNESATIILPLAFPTNIYGASATPIVEAGTENGQSAAAFPVGKSSITVSNTSGTAISFAIYWEAKGN